MITNIEVLASDVFGGEERVYEDYLNKFTANPVNPDENICIDESELPF